MITDEDVYEYLEHFGVKGMRWGKRTGRSRSPAENRKRAETFKNAGKVGAVATATGLSWVAAHKLGMKQSARIGAGLLGGSVAATILSKSGKVSLREIGGD